MSATASTVPSLPISVAFPATAPISDASAFTALIAVCSELVGVVLFQAEDVSSYTIITSSEVLKYNIPSANAPPSLSVAGPSLPPLNAP